MSIKVHHLRPAPGAKTTKTRVGRGEAGKPKDAGRGMKRKKVPAGFEGGQIPLHIRLPKLRGFKNPSRVEYQAVNVGDIAAAFPRGGTVGMAELTSSGLVKQGEQVKILGGGDVQGVKLDVTASKFSAGAREKLEAAGGSVAQEQ